MASSALKHHNKVKLEKATVREFACTVVDGFKLAPHIKSGRFSKNERIIDLF